MGEIQDRIEDEYWTKIHEERRRNTEKCIVEALELLRAARITKLTGKNLLIDNLGIVQDQLDFQISYLEGQLLKVKK